MKQAKLFTKFAVLCVALLCLSGCYEEQPPFLMESKADFQSPNGIYEILLFEGAKEALEKIDWSKYENKKIFYDVQQITDGYLDNVVASLVEYKFLELGANLLQINKTEDNKDKTDTELKKEHPYDYDISITVPIAGVYYYEGFLRRNYVSSVMVNVFVKQKDGVENNFSSGIIEKKFDKFIPSKTFIVSLWIILLSIIILFLFKKVVLNNKNR
ncbi:MAG: hypothetical protein KKD05_05450 [Candidatus Omnitrophica bacterium]|nr:hypothetical protein [Candidatus Omnitrophota bacterium]